MLWLKTLGDIIWNFETMVLKFKKPGKWYKLQGETEIKAKVVSCKVMARLLRKEREAVLLKV